MTRRGGRLFPLAAATYAHRARNHGRNTVGRTRRVRVGSGHPIPVTFEPQESMEAGPDQALPGPTPARGVLTSASSLA